MLLEWTERDNGNFVATTKNNSTATVYKIKDDYGTPMNIWSWIIVDATGKRKVSAQEKFGRAKAAMFNLQQTVSIAH